MHPLCECMQRCMASKRRLIAAWMGSLMVSSDKSARGESDEQGVSPTGCNGSEWGTVCSSGSRRHAKMRSHSRSAILPSRTGSRIRNGTDRAPSRWKRSDETNSENLQIKTKFIKHNPINRSRRATNLIKVLNRFFI